MQQKAKETIIPPRKEDAGLRIVPFAVHASCNPRSAPTKPAPEQKGGTKTDERRLSTVPGGPENRQSEPRQSVPTGAERDFSDAKSRIPGAGPGQPSEGGLSFWKLGHEVVNSNTVAAAERRLSSSAYTSREFVRVDLADWCSTVSLISCNKLFPLLIIVV